MSTIVDLLKVIYELRAKNEQLERENEAQRKVIETINNDKLTQE